MPDWEKGESDLENTRATGPSVATGGLLRPGSVVGGRYKIKSIIGRGGMGVVYLVEHTDSVINRVYALKALAPDQLTAANWQRFQSEGKAIAKLEHRHVVKIYDMGIDNGECPFYVMDLLEGPSLADFIRENGPLSMDQAVDIFIQICEGLGYAHKCGIIHRDVKPSNIILTSSSNQPLVKIVDFGLAKLVGAMAQQGQSQTATGEVFGSPFYMSPEQCLGTKIDERSDIYSLGCTLFEALTGRPPFRGETALQTVMMHQNTKPTTLARANPDRQYSQACEQLVALMLKKRQPERPQTMADVVHHLQRLKEGKSIKPRGVFSNTPVYSVEANTAQTPARSHMTAWLIAAVIGSLLVGAGLVAFIYKDQAQKNVKPATAVSEAKKAEPHDITEARLCFQQCRQISDGVSSEGGCEVRIFKFPTIPIGIISALPGVREQTAAGTKHILAGSPVTLQIVPPEGRYTLMFPEILSKIGNEDISCLNLDMPLEDDSVVRPKLSPDIMTAIKDWRALRSLSIHNFDLPAETIAALAGIHALEELRLRSTIADGSRLARLPWLDDLVVLDIKSIKNSGAVLKALKNSSALQSLLLDKTEPDAEALNTLKTCPHLSSLSVSDCNVDGIKLRAICKVPTLTMLNLKSNPIKDDDIRFLSTLHNLRTVNLKGTLVTQGAVTLLRQKLPACTVEWP